MAGEVDPRSGELIFIGRYGEAFGGGHYDTQLANSIADELRIPASAIAKDPGALLSLRVVAKRLKESLSRQLLFDEDASRVPQRTVTLVMRDGEIFRSMVKLDKARFQNITSGLHRKFTNLIENGLKAIDLEEKQIGQIVLVGGGSQLFSIYKHLEERFPDKDLILADNPDESVVVGTSLEYGAASERARPSLLFLGDIEAIAEKTDEPLDDAPRIRLISWNPRWGTSSTWSTAKTGSGARPAMRSISPPKRSPAIMPACWSPGIRSI